MPKIRQESGELNRTGQATMIGEGQVRGSPGLRQPELAREGRQALQAAKNWSGDGGEWHHKTGLNNPL